MSERAHRSEMQDQDPTRDHPYNDIDPDADAFQDDAAEEDPFSVAVDNDGVDTRPNWYNPTATIYPNCPDTESRIRQLHKELASMTTKNFGEYAVLKPDGKIEVCGGDNDDSEDMVTPDYPEMDTNDPRNESMYRSELVRPLGECTSEKMKGDALERKLFDLEQRFESICSFMAMETKDRVESSVEIVTLKSNVKDMKDVLELLKTKVEKRHEVPIECHIRGQHVEIQLKELKKLVKDIITANKNTTEKINADLNNVKMEVDEKVGEMSNYPEMLKEVRKHLSEAKQLQEQAEQSNQKHLNDLKRAKDKARYRSVYQMQDLQRSFEVMEISLKALQFQVGKLKHTLPYQDGEECDVD